MSVSVRGKVPSGWSDQTARHITERLQALERALAGGAQVFLSPSIPTFGTGTVPPSGGGGGGGTGVTDHGGLTGLADDDHTQYALRGEPTQAKPHDHQPDDVVGLEQRFIRRGESARALPHVHTAEELDLDARFYRRGERVPPNQHNHVMADVSNLRPDDEQFVLAGRMFGG